MVDRMIMWMNKPVITVGESVVTIGGISLAFLIMFAALVLSSVIRRIMVSRLLNKTGIRSASAYAISRVLHYLFIVIGAIIAAQCVGLNLSSLAVVFGFLSVGIGFGLQNITSNFISGLILLFERPIGVGDYVTVSDQFGIVKEINMRSSLIETLDNVRIIVPNSKFIEGDVINWSHGSLRVRIHCPVGVAYGSDTKLVKDILLSVAEDVDSVLKNPKPEVRFLEFGDSSLNFELLAWINSPEYQKSIKSEINFRIDDKFREAGVQIPFPQRDLHLKSSDISFGSLKTQA